MTATMARAAAMLFGSLNHSHGYASIGVCHLAPEGRFGGLIR
jgi:hypothetical protein